MAIRFVLGYAPEGKLRREAFCCTELQASPVQILPGGVRRWSVAVTFEEGRAHLGLATQRKGRIRPSPAPPCCRRGAQSSPYWLCGGATGVDASGGDGLVP